MSNHSKTNVAIIILNWNGKKDTKECLMSLQNLSSPPFMVIVVDNGSTDGSVPELKEIFPSVTYLETGQNLGFAGGNNVGIKHALEKGADAVLLLNNDTIVDPLFLEHLSYASLRSPEIGIVGAKIYLFEQRDRLDHIGGNWNADKAKFDLVGNRVLDNDFFWDEDRDIDYVCGAALYVKKEVFEKIGFLEEKFFLIWEESDFCIRAKRAGFFIRSSPKAKIWHKVSASFTGGKPHSNYFWWRNRLLWIERNLSGEEKKVIYRRVLLPEIAHLLKLRLIKSIEYFLLLCLCRRQKLQSKKEKLIKYRAAWQGIRDYAENKFGQGPAWIYKRPS